MAVDVAGNAQASPYLINIHTAPDVTAPVPLLGSGPSSVSFQIYLNFALPHNGLHNVWIVHSTCNVTVALIAVGLRNSLCFYIEGWAVIILCGQRLSHMVAFMHLYARKMCTTVANKANAA